MIEPQLIDFEGADGSGKTTIITRLAQLPEFAGDVFAREPGGTEFGERIRAILKDPNVKRGIWSELFAFMAARSQLIEEVVAPALKAGRRVFLDRYYPSTLAYQWGAQLGHQDPQPFMQLPEISGMPFPGLVVWHDLEPEIALARRPRRESSADHFDGRDLDFHRRVRASYTHLFTYQPWSQVVRRIDASQTPAAVFTDTLRVIREHLHSSSA